MNKLTPKQEQFCQIYVDTGNASEAYRTAYSSKAKPESVNVEASKQLREPKISLRVSSLREELEEKALWRRIDSIKTLSLIASGSDENAKTSDRVNAVKALNSMHGWDAPSRVDVTTGGEKLSQGLDTSKLSTEALKELMAARASAESDGQ